MSTVFHPPWVRPFRGCSASSRPIKPYHPRVQREQHHERGSPHECPRPRTRKTAAARRRHLPVAWRARSSRCRRAAHYRNLKEGFAGRGPAGRQPRRRVSSGHPTVLGQRQARQGGRQQEGRRPAGRGDRRATQAGAGFALCLGSATIDPDQGSSACRHGRRRSGAHRCAADREQLRVRRQHQGALARRRAGAAGELAPRVFQVRHPVNPKHTGLRRGAK